jgi:hypothetical protein
MLRALALTGIALAFTAGLAAPASATADPVQPCHGTTYRYGVLVTNPVDGRVYRLCIEQ